MTLHCVPPPLEGARAYQVVACGHGKGDEVWVELSGVEDRTAADRLVGLHCLMDRDAVTVATDEVADEDLDQWIDWRVVDETSGFSGTVREVLPRLFQPLLIVEDDGGAQFMIPFADELVVDLDEADRRIVVDLPAGLETL